MFRRIDQLRLSAKLGLISILFLIPIGLMIQLFVSQCLTETDFASLERSGVAYIRAIWPAFERAAQTDATVDDVAAIYRANVTPMTALRSGDARTEATYAKALQALGAPRDAGSMDRVRAALLALIGRAADASNLTLDPDIDSYYIMDLVTVKLPELGDDIHALDTALRNMAHDPTGAFAARTAVVMAAARLRDAIDAADHSYAAALGDNPDGSLAAALPARNAEFRAAAANLAAFANRTVDRIERDASVDLDQLTTLVNALERQTGAYWLSASTCLDHLLEARIDRLTFRLYSRLGIAIAVILLTFAFVGYVSRTISGRIGTLSQRLKDMAAGDLDSAIPFVQSTDELGRIAQSLLTFRDAMASVAAFQSQREADEARLTMLRRSDLQRLATAFEDSIGGIVRILASAASELEIAAGALTGASEHTGRQSSAAAEATATTTTNVAAIAAASQQLIASVTEIASQTKLSETIASRAVTEATLIRGNVADLSQFAARIGGIVSLIDAIAAQTNLLALNATIESARAGEGGSGFAVVALEVKQLADQTSRATAEIGDHVSAIQAATGKVAEGIDGIGHTVGELGQTSRTIASSVEHQDGAAREIADRIGLAVDSATDVNRNVTRIARATTESVQSAASILGAATKLSKQAEFLRSEVTHFLQTIRAA